MNKVILTGWIGKNFKTGTTAEGKTFYQFDLATKREYKKDGKYVYDYPHCQIWNPKLIEYVKKYLDAGMQVEIMGSFQTDLYFSVRTKKRVKIDFVNVEKISLLNSKAEWAENGISADQLPPTAPKSDGFESMGTVEQLPMDW